MGFALNAPSGKFAVLVAGAEFVSPALGIECRAKKPAFLGGECPAMGYIYFAKRIAVSVLIIVFLTNLLLFNVKIAIVAGTSVIRVSAPIVASD